MRKDVARRAPLYQDAVVVGIREGMEYGTTIRSTFDAVQDRLHDDSLAFLRMFRETSRSLWNIVSRMLWLGAIQQAVSMVKVSS